MPNSPPKGDDCPNDALNLAAQLLNEPDSVAFAIADQGKKNVLGTDISVPHAVGNALGRLQGALAASRDVIRVEAASHALSVNLQQLVADSLGGEPVFIENGLRSGIVRPDQTQQNVLRAHEGVPHLLRTFKRQIKCDVCFFAESLEVIHYDFPLFF